MRKKGLVIVITLVVLLAGAVGAGAQVRLDADINVPLYVGY